MDNQKIMTLNIKKIIDLLEKSNQSSENYSSSQKPFFSTDNEQELFRY
jgi:hypothetical protein